MKTTVEIPDDLLIEAKKRSAELRVPLRQLVEEGLRSRLAEEGRPVPRRKRRIEWVVVDGGLPEGMDVSDRESMYAHIERGDGDRG
ncbi:MAG: hypothetical protein JXR96_19900 [Deltaproteobacteria bacterium]|nr:hypothetical protein [Deltaproteobacteria bacterium]